LAGACDRCVRSRGRDDRKSRTAEQESRHPNEALVTRRNEHTGRLPDRVDLTQPATALADAGEPIAGLDVSARGLADGELEHGMTGAARGCPPRRELVPDVDHESVLVE